MTVSTVSSHKVRLIPMTPEMYHRYFREYENDPDLYLDKENYVPYSYSEEKVDRYIQRQADLKRIPLAIMADDEIVGEVIIKNIEEHRSAVLSISLKNAAYKDRKTGFTFVREDEDFRYYRIDRDSDRTGEQTMHAEQAVAAGYHPNEAADDGL